MEVRLLSEEVTRGFYDFRRKVGAFIGAAACNEGYWWEKLYGNDAILSAKSAIFHSEFIQRYGKIPENKPLGLVFWQSRVKVHSALTLLNGARHFATP